MDPKPYLDYLDKEMTIMGILSAFCVAAPAGILVTVTGKDSPVAASLWNSAQLFVIAGSFFCILAASLFYKQRSILAWYYGQISLVQSRNGNIGAVFNRLEDWFREADAWSTWWPYCWGFTFLLSGFAEYFLAISFLVVPMHWKWLAIHTHQTKTLTFVTCPIVAAISCWLQYHVRTRYKYEDDVWSAFWKSLAGRTK